MVDPVVSVVIPSYNRAHVVAETLESVLAQTYPVARLDIIVVDDGSRDATAEAVAPYQGRVRYIRQENQGLAAARNTGLDASRGAYVAWLDSDDLWNPEKIALQVAWMEQHPGHALIASDFSAFDDTDGFFEASHVRSYYGVIARTLGGLAGLLPREEQWPTRDLPHVGASVPDTVRVHSGDGYARLIGGNFLHPPTVLFRRDAATRAGRLDGAFRRDVDWEYLLRLSRQGLVAFIDRPLMRYRYSGDQMSSDKHLVDITLSRLLVLESLARSDRTLLGDPAFRRRLGYSHLAAAHALADGRRGPALQHLAQSLRWAYADGQTLRTVAKLCLPRFVVERVRRRA